MENDVSLGVGVLVEVFEYFGKDRHPSPYLLNIVLAVLLMLIFDMLLSFASSSRARRGIMAAGDR